MIIGDEIMFEHLIWYCFFYHESWLCCLLDFF